MADTPPATRSLRRSIAYSVAIWVGYALVHVVGGYAKSGILGVKKELLDFLFMNLVLVPVLPALFGAQKLEQRLKRKFPVGASFMAIAAALAISVPPGLYVAIHVLRRIEG